jgi:hypothetical protein
MDSAVDKIYAVASGLDMIDLLATVKEFTANR